MLTLTTHDTAFDRPDDATIAKVLASLDGGRNILATLGESAFTYVQAAGSVQSGFTLEYQEGSLERHYRSVRQDLRLGEATEVFQRYAGGDTGWREAVQWERVVFQPPSTSWSSTWAGMVTILLLVVVALWLWLRR